MFEKETLDKLIKEYIIPGLKEYKKLHGFLPSSEIRRLKRNFTKPKNVSESDWTQMLERFGEEIEKMEGKE